MRSVSLLRPEEPSGRRGDRPRKPHRHHGPPFFYRAAPPLSSRTLTYASGVIRRQGSAAESWWRKLSPRKQALLVLVYLRKGETFGELAAGFGVGTTTAWKYVDEALLAFFSPKLREGGPGTPSQGRVRLRGPGRDADSHRPDRRRPAVLFRQAPQARDTPAGHRRPRRRRPVRVRGATGLRARQKAEWIWGVLAELEAAGLVTLADKGNQGSRYAKIPYRGRTSWDPRETPTAPTRTALTRRARERPAQNPGASSASSAAALCGPLVRQPHLAS